MEEQKKKNWFVDKKDRFLDFCKRHPEGVLTVVGGLFTIAGAAMNMYTTKNEFKDNVYLIQDDKAYRVPAKEMQSKKIETAK